MNIQENIFLSQITTFRIGGPAQYFVAVSSETELREVLKFATEKSLPVLILGGGSNMLVADEGFKGLVIQIQIKGRKIVSENGHEVLLKIGSGEVWDEIVEFAVSKNYWGLENLSNVPGSTGGVPVQNVGAYGQEASLVVDSVEVLNLQTLEKKSFSNQDCGFGYRSSNFNTIWKGQFVILSVTFKLSKQPKPNLTYTDVKKYFANNPNPSQVEIRQAIIEIRKNKFPDITKLGNAGSCFKNLILNPQQFEVLKNNLEKNFDPVIMKRLEDIRTKFPTPEGIKVPAAFLIEICGMKGQSAGFAKLWEKQALVIVNEGNATALNVIELFERVRKIVFEKTGMQLQAEPEFIGF